MLFRPRFLAFVPENTPSALPPPRLPVKLPVTLPASLAALAKARESASMVVGKEVWRRGCMRARLALLPSGWEADEEMEGRLRGLLDGGGGEDIMAVYVCMYVCEYMWVYRVRVDEVREL